MDGDLRTLLHTVLADPARFAEIPRERMVALIAELAGLQARFAALLQLSALPDRRNEPESTPDRLLTPTETAAALGETVRWLYRHAGELPFTRRLSRKALRFSEAGLRAYMAGRPTRRGRP